MSETSEKQLPEKKSNTRKKLKYVGRETYINARTGEIETFAVEGIEERDFNFTKVWFEHLLASYDLIGNQKTKVANYIISNLNRDNQLICSYRKIAEETGVSYPTVQETMKILLSVDFLQKMNYGGVYRINPDVLFKGTAKQRLSILQQYQEEGYKPPEISDDQKIKELENSIAVLQKELDKLKHPKVIDTEIAGQMEMLPDGSIVERATDEKPQNSDK